MKKVSYNHIALCSALNKPTLLKKTKANDILETLKKLRELQRTKKPIRPSYSRHVLVRCRKCNYYAILRNSSKVKEDFIVLHHSHAITQDDIEVYYIPEEMLLMLTKILSNPELRRKFWHNMRNLKKLI